MPSIPKGEIVGILSLMAKALATKEHLIKRTEEVSVKEQKQEKEEICWKIAWNNETWYGNCTLVLMEPEWSMKRQNDESRTNLRLQRNLV